LTIDPSILKLEEQFSTDPIAKLGILPECIRALERVEALGLAFKSSSPSGKIGDRAKRHVKLSDAFGLLDFAVLDPTAVEVHELLGKGEEGSFLYRVAEKAYLPLHSNANSGNESLAPAQAPQIRYTYRATTCTPISPTFNTSV